MIFAKFDVDLRDNRKARKAARAMATWTWGLLYSRGQELDGFVDREALRGSWVGEEVALQDAQELVAAGLWAEVQGGWKVLNYASKNDTKKVIDARKEADRKRKKSKGSKPLPSARNPDGIPLESDRIPLGFPGTGTGTGTGSDLSSESVRDPEPLEDRSVSEGTAGGALVIADYEQAVSAVTGAMFVLDYRSGDRGRLVRIAAAYCKGKPIAEVRQWVRESVDEWVRPRVDEPDFASGFAPRGFETWLRGGRKPPKRPVSFVRTKNADRQPHDEGWLIRLREREAADGTGTNDFGGGK